MKELLTNLALFVVFCIAFSGLTSCGGSQANISNPNTANAVANANPATPATAENKSSGYPPLAAGLAEADLELLDGTKTKVSDHKGKVVLLNIWGIWCGPCRQEMPHLVAMQQQYGDKGFEILGLNIGDQDGGPENVEDIKKFSTKMGLNYTLARIDTAGVRQFYRVTSQQVVPQSLLIDREGHLRGMFIGGGSSVITKLQEVLDKTMAE